MSDNGIGPLKAKAGGSAKTLRYSLRMNTEYRKTQANAHTTKNEYSATSYIKVPVFRPF